jgi:hypothetical protein
LIARSFLDIWNLVDSACDVSQRSPLLRITEPRRPKRFQ